MFQIAVFKILFIRKYPNKVQISKADEEILFKYNSIVKSMPMDR